MQVQGKNKFPNRLRSRCRCGPQPPQTRFGGLGFEDKQVRLFAHGPIEIIGFPATYIPFCVLVLPGTRCYVALLAYAGTGTLGSDLFLQVQRIRPIQARKKPTSYLGNRIGCAVFEYLSLVSFRLYTLNENNIKKRV